MCTGIDVGCDELEIGLSQGYVESKNKRKINVDITHQSPSVLSICTGYGGLEIALERIFGNINTLAHVEIEAFAIANLVNKMETGRMVPAPVWTDVKTLPLEPFRDRVDILVGGYPCQPFSVAGKRKGKDDPRHLFPAIKRIITGVRPLWCFFENVDGHISMGLSSVISDLEEMGYETTWGVFSAAEVGAPHQRKRVFILAHRISEGLERHTGDGQNKIGQTGSWEDRSTSKGIVPLRRPEELAYSKMPKCEQAGGTRTGRHGPSNSGFNRWPARPGEEQYEWEEPRVLDGKLNADWVESLQGLME